MLRTTLSRLLKALPTRRCWKERDSSLVSSDQESIVLHFDANTTGQSRNFTVTVLTTDDVRLENISFKQSCRNVEQPGEFPIDEVFFSGFLIPGAQTILIPGTATSTSKSPTPPGRRCMPTVLFLPLSSETNS